MARGSRSSDEAQVFMLLLLVVVGGGMLWGWMQIKAAAAALGVEPGVLLKAGFIAALMIGATTFVWIEGWVDKILALWATTATLLWIAPVRMLLNSMAELAQSPIGGWESDTSIVFWYNDWPFVWGVGLGLAVLAYWLWHRD